MEILNHINENLKVTEEADGLRFGMDAYLLAAFVRRNAKKTVLETCCGSGVISMLLLAKNKCASSICVDIQPQAVCLCEKNASENGLTDRVKAVCADVTELKLERQTDICLFNPPYMRRGSGKVGDHSASHISRHETTADIFAFMDCAARNVKDGGDVYAVYTPDRLSELICAASRSGLEPKKLILVYPTPSHRPCLALLQCKKGAAPDIYVSKPLIIYENEAGGEYSADMKYIYENMSFSEGFDK